MTKTVPPPEQLSFEPHVILDASTQDLHDIDPDRRITLASLCRSLGTTAMPSDEFTDPLAASKYRGIDVASWKFIESGLYIYRDDPRYETAEQLVLPRSLSGVQHVLREGLKLPFNLRQGQPGIVVHANEVKMISFSPANLVNIVKAKVREKNQDQPDSEEVQRKANSGAAQALREKIEKLQGLERTILDESTLLGRIILQTHRGVLDRRTPQNQFKARNLDKVRSQVDELAYETLQTAAVNNYLSTQDKKYQLAQVRKTLYGGNRSAKEIDVAWYEMAAMLGQYGNARRLVVLQQIAACQRRFVMHRHAIKDDPQAAYA